MKHKHYLILAVLFTMTLAGCSKSGDDVTPATDLLIRKWTFPEINVKTDTKAYTI
jgi:PBP1b-binding outer membrane lipoprotein LpoB